MLNHRRIGYKWNVTVITKRCTKVFSLQRGDLVSVNGTVSLRTPNMPDLKGQELTVMILKKKEP
jgi:hypothetical protein